MSKRFHSPTSINTYLRCPRKYYLRYIKGLKSKPSIHLVRGKAVHDAIAQFTEMSFDKNADPVKIILQPGEQLEFKHLIVIGGDLSDKEINSLSKKFK